MLLGHGSTVDEDAGASVRAQAAALKNRRLFAEVREAFWKQEPQVKQVLSNLTSPRVFIVPMFISEGHFSEVVIPAELGFRESRSATVPAAAASDATAFQELPFKAVTPEDPSFTPQPWRAQKRQSQKLYYCLPIGSHEDLAQVLVGCAREVVERFPFPRPPSPRDTTLFIAGHGTEQNQKSRESIERQAAAVRKLGLYAAVHPVFLEESPQISECYDLARTRNVVVVPFFIGDGPHVKTDIPVLLGEPQRLVQQRLKNRQPTWCNPSERRGKLVWYASSIGSAPQIVDVIISRVQEAAQPGLTDPGSS